MYESPETTPPSTIRKRLDDFEARGKTAKKHAAVALIIVDSGYGANLPGLPVNTQWTNTPALILTVRASTLRSHAGQWALPGGRTDEGETPLMTAIRETQEEVSLTLNSKNFLGFLDDYETRSGYTMTPLVFHAGSATSLTANPSEVAAIHRIPFTELLREDAPILDYKELSEQTDDFTTSLDEDVNHHPVLRMPIGDSWIAAPTAAILYQFREVCLRGINTRVAHFEQPRFTWT